MAQILLIYPKLVDEGEPVTLLMPLSLVYVAHPVVESGYSVRILDQRVTSGWESIMREELLKGETICVGISAMTGLQIKYGILAAKLVREYAHDVPIVWGGVHPSLLPEQTAKDEHVDVVVIGEGEKTFLEVVRKIEAEESLANVPGICYLHNGKVVRTPPRSQVDLNEVDISSLPYHLLKPVEPYLTNPLGYISGSEKEAIPCITSRGCPFGCTYCYNIRFNRRRWRAYDPETVIRGFRRIVEGFGVEGIFLMDDNFFTSIGRVKRICEGIIETGLKVKFYNVNCRLDILGRLDPAFLGLLKDAGIHSLFIGVESASPRILKGMKKSINVQGIFEIDRKLQTAGIVPTYSFMVGLPGESAEDIKMTLRLMCQILDANSDACISPQVYIPGPGSEMFDACVAGGLVSPQELSQWADFPDKYFRDLAPCSWFDEREKRFLKKVAIMMQVIDTKKNQRDTTLKELLRKMYSAVVRFRIRRDFYTFMPELRLRDVPFLKFTEKAGAH